MDYGASNPSNARYGGFWVRLCAYIIDCVILWAFFYIGSTILFMVVGESENIFFHVKNMDPDKVSNTSLQTPFDVVGFLFSLVLPWLYFTLFESSRYQATPGKKVLGLKVVDSEGNRIGFGRANARFWSKILSALILYFGFFMIGWTKYKQGLHDKMADTFVIRKS